MKNVRELYISKGILDHDQYWGFLAELLKPLPLPVSLDRLLASNDPHLNDIPLIRWDRLDPIVRRKAIERGASYFTMNTDPPCSAWSLSDTVCVLKAYARSLIETERAKREREGEA